MVTRVYTYIRKIVEPDKSGIGVKSYTVGWPV